ncbi:MAG TPA: SusE domain-containing protein [Bacteroidales bacterium]|jgi:hypothetical protein|nr:SusE domain-containing protein [Bacteroidales bacterium]
MRKISFLLTLIAGVFIFFGCEKDAEKITISANPSVPAFQGFTDNQSTVLLLADASTPITYTWSKADFGFQAATTYAIQMAKQGTSFADAVTVATTTNAVTATITTNDLNNKILAMQVNPDDPVATAVEWRVKATINPDIDPIYSSVITQTITPFYIPIVYPRLFVPGNYQGWNPGDSTTCIFSLKSNNIYEGYVWFGVDNAMFKYCEQPNWDVNWGDNGNDGTLESGGSDIPAAAPAGLYKLNVDLVTKTHSFMRTDWGLVGSATPGGWDSDQNMTYDPATRTLVITLDLVAGEIKFRANDAWDLNYGDDGANGSLEPGGTNIAIAESGNYTITLDFNKPIYKYKIKKN